jgi:hypothetical protein
MTKQKTFKRRVRERMERTGESYVSARAALIGEEPPGRLRETSALKFALADAGIEISEALLLIICGGAGVACMSFRYEAEDFTHFHLSGWNPFQSDVVAAVERLDLRPDIHETGGAKTAEKALKERLGTRVQIAWVEDYSVLGVAAIDGDTARVYDREVKTIPAEELQERRGRIRKQKHRLLAIEPGEPDVEGAVRKGLIACANGAVNPPSPGMSLDGIARWADELENGWPKFPPGKHRDGALTEIRAATRDGLLRRLQAQGLREAGFDELATRTDELAREWQALPDASDLASAVRALHAKEVETVEILKALLL